jgi:hypothetical protein
MKGLTCAECGTLRTLAQQDLRPVSCDCGNVTGWWIDGARGVARYTAKKPALAYGVGLHSDVLRLVWNLYGTQVNDTEWRDLFDKATDAPNYLFDKSRHGQWVIFFRPERGGDVGWATDNERAAVGLDPYPEGHALKEKI